MIIKILGSGCANCVNLERVTREAVADLGLDAQFEKVTDYPAIVGYGVMSTPGLVVGREGRPVRTAANSGQGARELLESLTA
jgi:small redox-active disulfide protein 2